jgi:hypothetical protein
VRRLGLWIALTLAGAAPETLAETPSGTQASAPPETPNQALARRARAAAPGAYPRWVLGEQSYWTVVGTPDDEKEGALSEDGALEVEKEAFSIEPFLFVAPDTFVTWRDAVVTQNLLEGDLPIPGVRWERGGLALDVRAVAAGPAGRSSLFASYRVENRGPDPVKGTLFLAVRPIQAISAWQFLNLAPGFAAIHELALGGGSLRVNVEKEIVLLTPPDGFGAGSRGDGELTDALRKGALPLRSKARDADGLVYGAFRYDFDLAPQAARDVHLEVPFYKERTPLSPEIGGAARAAAALAEARERWRAIVDRATVDLPPAQDELEQTVKASLAWILVHRDGPRLQPGSRSYERSWIRDGALTSAALLDFGFSREVGEYLRWYAPHQFPDGKIPCCIDARGADPTPEHDSNGEFLYAIAEYHRMTRDPALARDLWPSIVAAVGWLEKLRAERTTDEYRAPEKRAFFGLLPESISHEGYSKHPVHSYWDDLFALRGLRDAAWLARELGETAQAEAWGAVAQLQHDLGASMVATMERAGLAHLPASVELADFDPTATAVWLSMGGEPAALPEEALRRTFEEYGDELAKRESGELVREAWAPYEIRIADAFVRLGAGERAAQLLEFALADRRPPGWRQWPEILWHEVRAPQFLGDLPHGWIAATFLHAFRSALVYERVADGALVIAAGVPPRWLSGDAPLRARLPTWWGDVAFVLRDDGAGLLRARLDGSATPPGGFVFAPPLPRPPREVWLNGAPAALDETGGVRIGALPADVALRY